LENIKNERANTIEELRKKVHLCTSNMESLKTSLSESNNKVESLLGRNVKNEDFIEELRNQVRATQKDLDETEIKLADAQKEVSNLRKCHEDSQLQNLISTKEVERLNDELTSCRHDSELKISDKDRRIATLESSNKKAQAIFEEKLSTLGKDQEAQIKQMEERVENIKSELSKSRNAEVEAAAKIEKLSEQLKEQEQALHTKKNHELALRQRISDQDVTINDKISEVQQCEAEIAELKGKISEQNVLLDESDYNMQQLDEELSNVINKEEMLRSEVEIERLRRVELEGELSNAKKEISSLSAKLRASDMALKEIENSRAIMENELRLALADYDRLSAKMRVREASNEANESKQGESTYTIDNNLVSQNELEQRAEEIHRLTTKNEALDRKCIRLREYIKKLTLKCEEWAESYQSQSASTEEARRDHQEALHKISDLSRQVDAFESENIRCRETSERDEKAWEAERRRLEINTRHLEDELEGMRSVMQNLPKSNEGKLIEISSCQECKYLRKAIVTEGRRNSSLRDELETRGRDISIMTKKLNHCERRLKTLVKEDNDSDHFSWKSTNRLVTVGSNHDAKRGLMEKGKNNDSAGFRSGQISRSSVSIITSGSSMGRDEKSSHKKRGIKNSTLISRSDHSCSLNI